MENALQTMIDRLPQVIEKNAQAMMKRMVARMRSRLESGEQPGDVSHGLLFLKVAEAELVQAFLESTRAKFAAGTMDDLGGLSLEPESGRQSDEEFTASDAAFRKLQATASGKGGRGLDRFGREKFVGAMMDAFQKSRMDARATQELLPSARSALDAELQVLYTQLDGLVARAA